VLSQSELQDEEGLPLMEIQEELDEDGNITCTRYNALLSVRYTHRYPASSTSLASDAAPQVVNALRTAGVKDLPDLKQSESLQKTSGTKDADSSITPHVSQSCSSFSKDRPRSSEQDMSIPAPTAPKSSTLPGYESPTTKVRKSVAFAEGTKNEAPTRPTPANVRGAPPPNGSRVETINRDPKAFIPHVPPDESPEDAALRREMIRYSLNEVGAVVAEMNLDYDSDSDSDDHRSIRSSSDSDENEDQFGRSQNRVLNDEYMEEMRALEKKLNAKSLENIGPGGMVQTLLQAEDNLAAQNSGGQNKSNHLTAGGDWDTKEVHSNKALDRQRRPEEFQKALQGDDRGVKASRPAHTDIVENLAPARSIVEANTAPARGKRASRFKATRRDGANDASSIAHLPSTTPSTEYDTISEMRNVSRNAAGSTPDGASNKASPAASGPVGRTHAAHVVEHPWTGESDMASAPEPDEWDDSLMHQELSKEYHRMRKRMIQQPAGSVASNEGARREQHEEEDDEPLVDEKGKRISRFKADRLGQTGRG
ncbi:MAG: hypothetical protein Q9214_006784, partial [Letrouitia sp. 1 TL-2023]